MDPKASAKAKRSFSKQGRRNHPTPAMIAQKKKAAQEGSENKAQIAHSHVLSSNWDRYDVGEEEAESSSGTTLEGREIAPKSKGANFTYLIEQARSQPQELREPAMPELPSFFNQLTADFMRGVRSVNNVRRNNLLSQCEDDNFIVDDDHASNYEVPFLNLDLHALAAQLSKFKLSERLFIEDLFPDDLRFSDDSKGNLSSVESGQNMEAPDSFLHYPSSKTMLSHTEDHHITSFTDANISKSNQCVAGEAEAELDFLLESLKETTLQDDLCDEKISAHSVNNLNSDLIDKTFLLPSDGRIQAFISSSIDDSIDDLLAETAPVLKSQEHIKGSNLQLASMFSAPNDFSSGSKVGTEEFDSWMDSF